MNKEEVLKQNGINPDKLDDIIHYVGKTNLLKAMQQYADEQSIEKCDRCIFSFSDKTKGPHDIEEFYK